MSNTITLAEVESLAGVTAAKWERNGRTRHYLNVPGAAYTLYWVGDEAGGKVHFALGRGRSSEAAYAAATRVLGCNPADRYSRTDGPAPYVVVEG